MKFVVLLVLMISLAGCGGGSDNDGGNTGGEPVGGDNSGGGNSGGDNSGGDGGDDGSDDGGDNGGDDGGGDGGDTTDPVCGPVTITSGNEWNLVWSDEFESETIDATKWSFETNCAGGGNSEDQCYVNDPDNAFIEDGALHIRAIKEQVQGWSGWSGQDGDGVLVTREYSSTRLRTLNKGDWTYGRIEVRAKLPHGQGIWPAIWMLPTDEEYGGWPLSGEIDIMEAINLRTGGDANNKSWGTLHYADAADNHAHTGRNYDPGTDLVDQFHTFAVEWEAGEIRWYINDTHFLTQRQSVWMQCSESSSEPQNPAAPFDQDFHLLLNLAVGGTWPGPVNNTTVFPQTMVVDFVRVYECSADPETGHGCANVSPSAEVIE